MTQAITKPGILERIFAPRSETTTLSRPAQWLIDAIEAHKSMSGVTVNIKTAMAIPTFLACLKTISEDIGALPKDVYRRLPRGREIASEHRMSTIVGAYPNEEMTEQSFHETLAMHALGWSGGYAEIVRDGRGDVRAMYPLDPNTVTKERSTDGRIRYVVRVPGLPDAYLSEQNMFHIHGLGYDGISQFALVFIARESIGAAIANRNYRADWFANGVQPSGVLHIPDGFKPSAMENLRKSFEERHEGSGKKGKTLLLEAGVEWKEISVDAQKAQMVESAEYDDLKMCQLFRMPPQKVGISLQAAGWQNSQQFDLSYMKGALVTWIKRFEHEYRRKCFRPSENDLFVRFDTRGMLRSDDAARAALYTSMFQIGCMTQNEIRELEDMNPVEGGDKTFVQGALTPTDLLIEKLQADIEATKNPPQQPNQPSNDTKTSDSPQNLAVMVMAIASKHEAQLARELDALLKRESAKANKDDKWWADHLDNVILAFSRVLSSLGTSLQPNNPPDQGMHAFARVEAESHIQSSKTKPTDEHRAARDASGIIQRAVAEVLK